jgi:hypothetical protein
LTEETSGWLFVNSVPLLYDKKSVARQLQIENWLDLAQVIKELGIENPSEVKQASGQSGYIV